MSIDTKAQILEMKSKGYSLGKIACIINEIRKNIYLLIFKKI